MTPEELKKALDTSRIDLDKPIIDDRFKLEYHRSGTLRGVLCVEHVMDGGVMVTDVCIELEHEHWNVALTDNQVDDLIVELIRIRNNR